MAGTEQAVVAVCDAGPLIHLDELSCLDLLGDWCLRIAPSVSREIQRLHPSVACLPNVEQETFCPMITPTLATFGQSFSLDSGEMEALAIMEETPDALFLTDDAAARLVAEKLGYKTHGTIGVLLRAVRCGMRSPCEVIDLLRAIPMKSSLYIRPSLLSDIIAKTEKQFPK